MEYKKATLDDICLKITDGAHYSPKATDEGYPMYSVKDMKYNNFDNTNSKLISEKDYQKLVKQGCRPEKNDVVIAKDGSYLKHVFVISEDIKVTILSSIAILKLNLDLVNPYYLSYFLKQKNVKEHIKNGYVSGSVLPRIILKDFKKYPISLPHLKIQNKVVEILKKIDSKIDNNEQIIANLEELSQTLFKRWFVDFEFSDENGNPYKSSGGEMVDSELGEIPKSWTVKNLDDIANYVNGLAMQKYKHVDDKLSLPVVKIKELKNGSTDENSNRCTSNIPEKALINDGDIIFSWSATLLVKMWCGGKAGLNQHLFKVTSDKYPKWFYYYWTKRYIDYFIGIAKDKATTMGHINRKHLSHAKILLPNDQTMEIFSRTFNELLEKELSVSKENKSLIELRDTLLPKLMSGEIEIPNDIEVNEDELSI